MAISRNNVAQALSHLCAGFASAQEGWFMVKSNVLEF